jgi:uncharacterized protein YggE
MRFLKLAVIAPIIFFAGITSAQSIQINRDNKTIAISASDEATATADIAAVTIGFEVFGSDSQQAYIEGAKLSQGIIEALHKAGVNDSEIASSQQALERNTSFDQKDSQSTRAARQYRLQQSWEVSVPPAVAAKVIRLSVASGANKSGAIDWRLSDRKALQSKAAANALVKARSIATNMSEGLHVKLGDLIYASNQTPNTNNFLQRKWLNQDVSYLDNAESTVAESAPPLEIRPQTIREEATVYAVFAIE